MRPIVIGRDDEDREKFGEDGLAQLGKHYVTTGDKTNLANSVQLDLVRPHIILICGKRGQGKSYTLGVIAEEMALLPRRFREKLSVVIFDTMGIYWTMKYPNHKQEDAVKDWGLEPQAIQTRVLVPLGWKQKYKKLKVPFDGVLAIPPTELSIDDWLLSFEISIFSPIGILLERVLSQDPHSLNEMIEMTEADPQADQKVKEGLINRIRAAESWGIFSDQGTAITDILTPGTVNVLDFSLLSHSAKSLLIGLITKKIFDARMLARKEEERAAIQRFTDIGREYSGRIPMPWILIDEAHEFLPEKGKTSATASLVQAIREGRQPGMTLVFATQQPGKIHTDVLTQADLVISHRVTAMPDIQALNNIMGTYMRFSLEGYLSRLPKYKGAAIILDDNAEKVYPIRVRPRISWHGGESASLIR
ncbi:MAG: ATP-binding protein [Candidatus Altiarchaeota archaeon]|nr:ATP-binding protein [Candidatus Altiarchaeota archaeon]